MNKKFLVTSVLVLSTALLFAACGETEPKPESTMDSAYSETTKADETTRQQTTLPIIDNNTDPASTTPVSALAEKKVLYSQCTLNVRKSPSTDSEILGKLYEGDKVEATGRQGDWYVILYGGKTAYAHSNYLSEVAPASTLQSDRIVIDPTRSDWNLVVVNASREMPAGYEPKLAEIFDTGVYMDYRVAPHYEEMYTAAKADGIILTPFSGYRSYARQKRNYENLTETYMSRYNLNREQAAKKAATVILPPGTSEHNLGLAMDICNTYDSFAQQKEYAWLVENAHKYGFILRYTAEKQSITGIVPEPWHWRYVGVEYAEKIKNSGLCLEEYLDSVGIAY